MQNEKDVMQQPTPAQNDVSGFNISSRLVPNLGAYPPFAGDHNTALVDVDLRGRNSAAYERPVNRNNGEG